MCDFAMYSLTMWQNHDVLRFLFFCGSKNILLKAFCLYVLQYRTYFNDIKWHLHCLISFFSLWVKKKKKKRSEVKGLPNYENIDCKTGIKPIILNMLRKKKDNFKALGDIHWWTCVTAEIVLIVWDTWETVYAQLLKKISVTYMTHTEEKISNKTFRNDLESC